MVMVVVVVDLINCIPKYWPLTHFQTTLFFLSVLLGFLDLSNIVYFVVRDDGTTRLSHKKSKEDTFGQNDEDWMVYRAIVSNVIM